MRSGKAGQDRLCGRTGDDVLSASDAGNLFAGKKVCFVGGNALLEVDLAARIVGVSGVALTIS